MAEVCTSQDGAFIALRLYQFINMNYEPVIGTCRFEGEKAQIIKQLFQVYKKQEPKPIGLRFLFLHSACLIPQ